MLPPKLAALRDALEAARAHTLRLVSSLAEEEFRRAEPGEWSAGEILEHLLIAETGASKVIRKVLKDRAGAMPPYPADDSGIRVREFPVSFEGMKAPEVAVPKDVPGRDALLERAARTREQTLRSLEMLAPFDPTKAVFPHPMFGEMTLYEWLAVIVLGHERQHHRQLERLVRAPGAAPGPQAGPRP